MHTRIARNPALVQAEVLDLYTAVGWSAYTDVPEALMRSLAGSDLVLSARSEDDGLVGLARTVSDGVSICFVQDLLVHPSVQRRGVGRQLMSSVLDEYRHVRALLLTTDSDDPRALAFYRALGLVTVQEQGLVVFSRPS